MVCGSCHDLKTGCEKTKGETQCKPCSGRRSPCVYGRTYQSTRPITVCKSCRETKLRCDKKAPCGECTRKGQECSLYPQTEPGPSKVGSNISMEAGDSHIHTILSTKGEPASLGGTRASRLAELEPKSSAQVPEPDARSPEPRLHYYGEVDSDDSDSFTLHPSRVLGSHS